MNQPDIWCKKVEGTGLRVLNQWQRDGQLELSRRTVFVNCVCLHRCLQTFIFRTCYVVTMRSIYCCFGLSCFVSGLYVDFFSHYIRRTGTAGSAGANLC